MFSLSIKFNYIGSKPATDFLKNSPIKLSVNNYVYVDQHMRTNLSDVYAGKINGYDVVYLLLII